MIIAQELINDGGISVIGATFFTALFGAVSAIGVAIVRTRHATEDLKNVTVEAAENAAIAKENTDNVSNGFTQRMDTKLNRIIDNQDELSKAFRDHLEWHLNKETSK
jgi:hypothetical protein